MSDQENGGLSNNANAWSNAMTALGDALVPRAVKALDRLVGAGVDIPAAWLERHAENIRSKTKSQGIVEAAIADKAGLSAASDSQVVDRAVSSLLRKEYRRTENREQVAKSAVRMLESHTDATTPKSADDQLDEDWLNIFERFAEDASTERMQDLWGRVLAGEIRSPGAYSLRTLRFLSEFSQSDAVLFTAVCEFAIGKMILKKLAKPDEKQDIQDLLQLEASGLIIGASGLGLTQSLTFDPNGYAFLFEGNLALVLKGAAGTSIDIEVIVLTPLGMEALSLIPNRDCREIIRRFGHAIRSAQITTAFIGHKASQSRVDFIEQLWFDTSV